MSRRCWATARRPRTSRRRVERAYRRQRGFEPRRGSPRAWLFGIARNAALDELRRRKRSAALAAEPADLEAQAPEDGAEAAVSRAAVRAALATLDPRERELIALKFHARAGQRRARHRARRQRHERRQRACTAP